MTVNGISSGCTEVRAKLGSCGDCVCETADVTVGCTPGRKYVWANEISFNVYAIQGTIKTRYGELCCEPCGEVTAFAVAHVNMGKGPLTPEPAWGQIGYGQQRNEGSTTIEEYRYWEVVGPASNDEFDTTSPPIEGSIHTYKIQLEKSTGTWKFYYDDSLWGNPWTHPDWEDETFYNHLWSGEIYNKEDDMPGTSGDRCEFTNCGYWKEGAGYVPAGFTNPDSYFTNDASEWGYEHVSGTAFNIWDKNPGE